MPNNPLPDEQLAELDRLAVSASQGGLASLVDQETYRSELARTYPALRQRLTDAESRLAEAEREREELEAELEEERAHSIEYEKDCTKTLCSLAREFDFEWDGDGATADELREFISETVSEAEKIRKGLAARDAQQRREGAAEWLEKLIAAKREERPWETFVPLQVLEQAAQRLREVGE